MLRTSTKNVAYEVISCLVDNTGRGVLTEIIKWLTTSNQNLLNNNESILNQLSRKQKDERNSEDEEPESFHVVPVAAQRSLVKDGEVRIKIRKNSIEPH